MIDPEAVSELEDTAEALDVDLRPDEMRWLNLEAAPGG